MKKIVAGLLLCVLAFSGCQRVYREPVTREIFAMDTYMTITCYGKDAEQAADAAVTEINRLDGLWSVGKADSEVSVINQDGAGTVSEETKQVLETALRLYNETDGALDITVYPLMELWGFTGEEQRVPDPEALTETLSHVDADQLVLADDILTLGEEQGIDLGAVAKGYTSTRVMEVLKDYQLTGAVLSLGGNVQVMGEKPAQDGSAATSLWRVGIQRPDGGEGYLGILTLTDKAVITSGGYERYFVEDGVTYHHILDPATGYPANSGLVSVTIISADGALADGLSTACFVMGLEKSTAYWHQHENEFDMILLTDAGELYVTQPIVDSLQSDFEIHVIE